MKLPEELQFIENARKPLKTTTVRLDGKVCIITGATSGVGREAAKRIARAGAHLVLVNRNEEKAAALKAELAALSNAKVDLVHADFSNLDDVQRAASHILHHFPSIHILINNAGVHMTTRRLTVDGFETAFAVNHLASLQFTH